MKMSEHQYDKRISESCVNPNPLMVERQDQDNFTRFQARERCALEIATYVFKCFLQRHKGETDHTLWRPYFRRIQLILFTF